jgi:hypothetical protein
MKNEKFSSQLSIYFKQHMGFKSKRTFKLISSLVQWSEFLATDPGVRVRLPALPEFLRSSGSGMGSTQPREYN